jgi:hypothetical protein
MTPSTVRKAPILASVFLWLLVAPSGLSARAGAPPIVTAHPDMGLVPDAGSEASFAAAADGSPAPAVQWQVAPDRSGPWTDIPGATEPTLTFTATDVTGDLFALGNAYRAVFTNSGGTAQSRPAKLLSRVHWMRDLGGDIAFLPLTELTIPGAHDMGTYGINGDSDDSTDKLGFACSFPLHNFCRSYGTAQDHNKNAAAELTDGIRYFDLRVCGHATIDRNFDEQSQHLVTCHALEAAPLQDILDQTRAFVDSHPGEVVILDFNHHFELNPDIEAARIEQAFARPGGTSLLIPPQYCTTGNPDSGTCGDRLTLHLIAQLQLGSIIVNFENDGAPGDTNNRCLPQQVRPDCVYHIQPVLDSGFYDRHPFFWGRLPTTPASNDQCTFGAAFPSCFGNDSDARTVRSRVRASLSDNAHYARDPDTGVDGRRFFVQFLQTTPGTGFILENPGGSLLDMAMESNPIVGPSLFDCGGAGDECFGQFRAENLNVLPINFYNRTEYTVGHTLVPPVAGACHDRLSTCPLTPTELSTLQCIQDTETFQVTSCSYEDFIHFDFVEQTIRFNGYARTAPVVTVDAPLDPASTGWYNAAVLGGQGAPLRLDVTGTDFRYPTGIGALDCSDVTAFTALTSGTSAPAVDAILPLGDGFHSLDCRSSDGASFGFHGFGHRGAGPGSTPAPASFLVDTTPPQILCPAAAFTLHEPVTTLTATVIDAVSGPVSAAVDAPVSTSQVGTFSVPISAADNAGNPASTTCSYTVSFQVQLRYDTAQPHASGSVVPVRVEIDDFFGVNVGGDAVAVTATGARSTATGATAPPTSPGRQTTAFHVSQGSSYLYDLKTSGYAAGDYTMEFIVSGDPTSHAAPFVIR